jgi:hypothetical protein
LSEDKKQYFNNLYSNKSPNALAIGKLLIGKIITHDNYTPNRIKESILDCINILNTFDLSRYYFSFVYGNIYNEFLSLYLKQNCKYNSND